MEKTKTYNISTHAVAGKPRSKRLQSLGASVSGGASVVNINGGGSAHVCKAPYVITENDDTPEGDSNVYSAKRTIKDFTRKAVVEAITAIWSFIRGINIGNYDPGKDGAAIDENGNAEVGKLVVRGDAAITGDVDAGSAEVDNLTVHDDAKVDGDAVIMGNVDAGSAEVRNGICVGDYVEGNSGASIDDAGNTEVESLVSRSWLKVRELIYNRLNAMEGDTSFADVGTIESVDVTTAVMRKRWDGDLTAFQPGDVVYGYVNNLDNPGAVEYGKAWAWVKSVDRQANTLTLVSYPDSETPAGKNMPVTAGMVITRWGNNIAPSALTAANPDYSAFIIKRKDGYVNTRQSTFMISTEQGNIMQLMGVNKPILDRANYGTVLGKIPAGMLTPELEELVNPEQPYLYVRGLFVQDIVRIGYEGVPVRSQNYRGVWDVTTASDKAQYYRNTSETYDTVTWRGAMWQNLVSGTTDEPTDMSPAWLRMTGTAAEARGLWAIVPGTTQIAVRTDGSISPGNVTCTVERHTVNGDYVYTTRGELDSQGAELLYGIDGGEMQPFAMGARVPLVSEDSLLIVTEDGIPIYSEGDAIASETVAREVRFELRDKSTGETLARATVAVVRDGIDGVDGEKGDKGDPGINGADGKDGKDGKDGSMGPIAYPAGMYNETNVYDGTAGSVPVVEYNGQYYVLRAGKRFDATGGDPTDIGSNPAENISKYTDKNPRRKWDLLEKFTAIYADIVMANFAKLSSAVFYGDFIFSQQGRDADGNLTYDYQNFAIENRIPTNAFTPEWWVDLRTGKSYMYALESSTARIGRLGIDFNGSLHNSTTSTTMDVEWDDMDMTVKELSFTHVVRDPNLNALIYSASYGQTQRMGIGGNAEQLRPVYALSINGTRDHSYGIYVNITDGTKYPHALYGRGNVTMDGVVTDYGVEQITNHTANMVLKGKYTHGTWLVTNTASGMSLMLPSRKEVSAQLGITVGSFAARLTIIGTKDCTTPILVWGRNSKLTGTGLNTDEYPIRLSENANPQQDAGLSLGKGDSMDLMLVWDGTEYYAYTLNYSV